MPNPTNQDLMAKLGIIESRVEATHNLAVKTNGRVTKLEGEFIAYKAVEDYKRDQATRTPAISSSNIDWQKIVLALIAVIGTALTIIGSASK